MTGAELVEETQINRAEVVSVKRLSREKAQTKPKQV